VHQGQTGNDLSMTSRNKCVREAAPVLKTGRKWSAKKCVVEAKAALQIGDIVGQVQHGRGGFGLSLAPQLKGGSW